MFLQYLKNAKERRWATKNGFPRESAYYQGYKIVYAKGFKKDIKLMLRKSTQQDLFNIQWMIEMVLTHGKDATRLPPINSKLVKSISINGVRHKELSNTIQSKAGRWRVYWSVNSFDNTVTFHCVAYRPDITH